MSLEVPEALAYQPEIEASYNSSATKQAKLTTASSMSRVSIRLINNL
jgi:hypothetical protein